MFPCPSGKLFICLMTLYFFLISNASPTFMSEGQCTPQPYGIVASHCSDDSTAKLAAKCVCFSLRRPELNAWSSHSRACRTSQFPQACTCAAPSAQQQAPLFPHSPISISKCQGTLGLPSLLQLCFSLPLPFSSIQTIQTAFTALCKNAQNQPTDLKNIDLLKHDGILV